MKVLEAEFTAGAASPEQIPAINLPEIAFAGRSNVGKSSLLNSIVHRKNLARISSSPGKTRQVNFYSVDKKWSFADLPGFGFAAVSKEERAKWANLNFSYLEHRKNLKMVFVLVDSRHDPMPSDLSLVEWLELKGRQYMIILTKCDKISEKQKTERSEQIAHLVSQCRHCREVLPYSSITGMGRNELLQIIKKVCDDKSEE